MHCGDRGQSSDSSSSPSTCLVPAAPPPHTHPSGPAPRKSAAGGHSREAAARGGLRGPGTPGSETGWEQSHGDDQPVGEGQGSKMTASFGASHRAAWGPRLASPARSCHPWQSSVYTTCGWSASPSWVSRSSLRPGTWKTAGRLGGVSLEVGRRAATTKAKERGRRARGGGAETSDIAEEEERLPSDALVQQERFSPKGQRETRRQPGHGRGASQAHAWVSREVQRVRGPGALFQGSGGSPLGFTPLPSPGAWG